MSKSDDDYQVFLFFVKVLKVIFNIDEDEKKEEKKPKTPQEREAIFEKVYKQVEDNWILDSDVMLGLLNHYLEKKDMTKCYKIGYVLIRHYRTKIDKKIEEWIKTEEYEKCQALKMMMNSIPK